MANNGLLFEYILPLTTSSFQNNYMAIFSKLVRCIFIMMTCMLLYEKRNCVLWFNFLSFSEVSSHSAHIFVSLVISRYVFLLDHPSHLPIQNGCLYSFLWGYHPELLLCLPKMSHILYWIPYPTFFILLLLVTSCCCNKLPQNGRLKQAQYSNLQF
jgi:hypothetical protein